MSDHREPEADRFRPSRRVLAIDRFMTRFIKVGGIGIIVAVLGMLVFIGAKVLPLFGGAKVDPVAGETPANSAAPLLLGVDEWGELPFVLDASGKLQFFPAQGEPRVDTLAEGKTLAAAAYDSGVGIAMLAFDDGSIAPLNIEYTRDPVAETLAITAEVELGEPLEADLPEGTTLNEIAFAESETARLVAVLGQANGAPVLSSLRYKRKRSLLGDAKLTLAGSDDLSSLLDGETPTHLVVNSAGDSVIVSTDGGQIFYLFANSGTFEKRQTFSPFNGEEIAKMEFLLGDNSLSLVSATGEHVQFALYKATPDSDREFGKTKTFPKFGAPPSAFASSLRNRSFLIAAGDTLSLRYGTSESVRWEGTLDFEPAMLTLNQKGTRIVALGKDGALRGIDIDDPHPEAGWSAYFGKIWYEDAPEPAYVWQSTGGSDEFESKLSLMPLIWGTLKGTFYAMLFALPIAILAAIYTSQFLHPKVKSVVKPAMEIMASLPSVVLGFLGALWLAPRIEHHTISLFLIVIFVPAGAFLLGWSWSRFPIGIRSRIKPGYEFFALIPLILFGVWVCWQLGPAVERAFFPREGGFTRWWSDSVGLRFEQRNCVIIGIMMGFAVIPIIFTITEDALSSVPAGLRSASLACGASRWQTAWRVVLPTASAGIFSATMIGLGRAVGETMIVVMATGNTPIMESNIFSGMRTLSANIAVELPEAPVDGTLYRTLFLGALVLFLMTFVLNTLAEVLRQHLREKYKTV